jgi:hypothetical protein
MVPDPLLMPEHWPLPKGGLDVSFPSPTVVLCRYHGRVDETLVPKARAAVHRAAAVRPIDLFIDAEELGAYTPDFRVQVTRWLREGKGKQIGSAHMLFRSPIVALGVSMLTNALGDFLKPHNQRAAFLEALDLATRTLSSRRGG